MQRKLIQKMLHVVMAREHTDMKGVLRHKGAWFIETTEASTLSIAANRITLIWFFLVEQQT